MESLSFLEKMQVLFQNVLAHPIFILILLLPAFLILFNKKITKKLLVIIYILILLVVLFVGGNVIFKLFDNVVNGIFMTLYFPNFITLFIVELISAIIMLITFIKEITKLSKRINIVAFSLIQGLFCLVLTVIKANKIDIYKENALYSNNDVLTLMQILMGVFLLQLLSLFVIYLVEKITNKLDEKDKPKINNKPIEVITPFTEKKIKQEKQKPLDKTLILDKHIVSSNLKEKIKEEEQIKQDKIKPSIPLDKTLILDKTINSKDLSKEIQKQNNIINKPSTPLDKKLIIDKSITPLPVKEEKEITKEKKIVSFDDFKPEFPDAKTKAVEERIPELEELSIKLSSKKPKEQKEEELIGNITIVNFDKTVKLIRNLKRIYTF